MGVIDIFHSFESFLMVYLGEKKYIINGQELKEISAQSQDDQRKEKTWAALIFYLGL